MNYLIRLHIFNELKPYLRLFSAYNRDHFQSSNIVSTRNIKSACYALCATLAIIQMFVLMILSIWNSFEVCSLLQTMIAIPVLSMMLTFELTFITLVLKNRTIIQTMVRIQDVLDQSKYCLLEILLLRTHKVRREKVF